MLVHLGQIVVSAPYPPSGMAVSQLYGTIRLNGEKILARPAAPCKSRRVPCERRLYVAIADRAADLMVRNSRVPVLLVRAEGH